MLNSIYIHMMYMMYTTPTFVVHRSITAIAKGSCFSCTHILHSFYTMFHSLGLHWPSLVVGVPRPFHSLPISGNRIVCCVFVYLCFVEQYTVFCSLDSSLVFARHWRVLIVVTTTAQFYSSFLLLMLF